MLQANLQHAKGASATLCKIFAEKQITIGLIQEPWVNSGQVRGLNIGSCKILYDRGADVPRAALLIDKCVNHTPITNFISRDLVAILLEIPTLGGSQEIVLASAYFPGDEAEIPPIEVQELIEYCRQTNRQFIIGCDANAHHTVWGSSDVNERGEHLLDYIANKHIYIINRGCKPTFITAARKEVLDLTFASRILSEFILNWRVSDEASLSDHQHIRFDIPGRSELNSTTYIPRKTNWNTFRDLVNSKADLLITTIRSICELEVAASQLNEVLISSYHDSNTAVPIQTTRKVPWWSERLTDMRRQVRRLFNKAKRNNRWDDYRLALTDYNKELRRSKRETWKRHCESIQTMPEAARLQRVMAKDVSNGIGLLKKHDGSFTETQKETLEYLLQVHFPGSTLDSSSPLSSTTEHRIGPNRRTRGRSGVIFDRDKVKWAVASFQPYKAPGGDGIFPALLQNCLETILDPLVCLFRASYNWGYIPLIWRKVRLVFILKQGKRPLELPKSYRPISLTSFLLKTMERLLDLHIRRRLERLTPLHRTQFAYTKGKSTEVALHSLVNRIEGAFRSKEIALCAFLDIEGAFDNTGFGSISRALARRGLDTHTVAWVDAMLKERDISATLGNNSVCTKAVKGCPQGGVLSPLLWSLVVDDLLVKLCGLGYEAIGYADDLAIIITGKFDLTVSDIMKSALREVLNWCVSEGLSINPNKTVLVPFTKRYRLDLGQISLQGIVIEYSNEVKYLGITLDRRLNWNAQLNNTLNKATRVFWACRKLFGRTWGLSPKMIFWLYNTIVKPAVTYAALVWWPKTQQDSAIAKCNKLQRLACLSITGVMRTCPTAAMEAVIGLTPLHISIWKTAAISALRVQLMTDMLVTESGHMSILQRIPGIRICFVTDHMTRELCFGRRFRVLIPERADWENGGPCLHLRSLNWFTDGSKMDYGAGAGVFGPNTRVSIPMGKWPSVFQTEIHAIQTCALLNLNKGLKGANITIYSDSQAALRALSSWSFSSKLVKECFDILQRLASDNRVTLCWVPGHCGVDGNEAADELAREGSSFRIRGPELYCSSRLVKKISIHRYIDIIFSMYRYF